MLEGAWIRTDRLELIEVPYSALRNIGQQKGGCRERLPLNVQMMGALAMMLTEVSLRR